MLSSKWKKVRGRDQYEQDRVIGFFCYNGKAGVGIALVHERRVNSRQRRDTVETYQGPVMWSSNDRWLNVVIETIARLIDYITPEMIKFEQDERQKS